MAQNPQLLLAQQNVARICQEGMDTANAICHDLTNAVEVPLLGSDAVSELLLMQLYTFTKQLLKLLLGNKLDFKYIYPPTLL